MTDSSSTSYLDNSYHHNDHDQNDDENDHRMVVFLGPHKSASSSVQELFMEHASDGPDGTTIHHPSLIRWTWPYTIRRRSYLPRKGFAPLVTENIGFHKLIWETMIQTWTNHHQHHNGTNQTDVGQHPNQHNHQSNINSSTNKISTSSPQKQLPQQHMIWGSEELDRFGKTPWSHRNGINAIHQVIQQMPPTHLDLIVNYRRPRQDQWISIWKQLYRPKPNQMVDNSIGNEKKNSYADFLCDIDEKDRLWEYLDCVANPLGLIATLLEAFPTEMTTVHLMDMQGIGEIRRDVGHVIACDVLHVPCTTKHWLPNIKRPIIQNRRKGDSGLSTQQLDDMEWLFLQRDCSYRKQLQDHIFLSPPQKKANDKTNESHNISLSSLVLHYAEKLWDECHIAMQEEETQLIFRNTTWLMEHLQSQVGCGPLSGTAIEDVRKQYQKNKKTPINLSSNPRQSEINSMTVRPSNIDHRPILSSSPLDVQAPDEVDGHHGLQQQQPDDVFLKKTATTQLIGMYLFLIVVIGTILRRVKCHRFHPQRRLAGRRKVQLQR